MIKLLLNYMFATRLNVFDCLFISILSVMHSLEEIEMIPLILWIIVLSIFSAIMEKYVK